MSRKIKASQFVIFGMFFLFPAFSSTVPADSIKESFAPALFSAVLDENPKLYSEEMEKLLDEPMKRFVEVIQFQTKEGDTIFHIMAGVRSHRQLFSKEIQNLRGFFEISSVANSGPLSLGGILIRIPDLKNTTLGKALENWNIESGLSILNSLGEIPAKEAIPILFALKSKSQSHKVPKDFPFRHLSVNQWISFLGQDMREKTKEDMKVFALKALVQLDPPDMRDIRVWNADKYFENQKPVLSVKNSQGLSPRNTAYHSENLQAYIALSEPVNHSLNSRLLLANTLMGAIIGMGSGLYFFHILHDFDEPLATGLTLAATAAGGLITGCYERFMRDPSELRKLRKKTKKNQNKL